MTSIQLLGLLGGAFFAWAAIVKIDVHPNPPVTFGKPIIGHKADLYSRTHAVHAQLITEGLASGEPPRLYSTSALRERILIHMGANTKFLIVEREKHVEVLLQMPDGSPAWWQEALLDLEDDLDDVMPSTVRWNVITCRDIEDRRQATLSDPSAFRTFSWGFDEPPVEVKTPASTAVLAAIGDDPPSPRKPRSQAGPGGTCYDCGKRGGHVPGCPQHRATPMPAAEDDLTDVDLEFDDIVDKQRLLEKAGIICDRFIQHPDFVQPICYRCGVWKDKHPHA